MDRGTALEGEMSCSAHQDRPEVGGGYANESDNPFLESPCERETFEPHHLPESKLSLGGPRLLPLPYVGSAEAR